MRFFAYEGAHVKRSVVYPLHRSASAGSDHRLRQDQGQQGTRSISHIVARFIGKPVALRSSAAALLICHRSAWPTSSPKQKTFPTRHVTHSPEQWPEMTTPSRRARGGGSDEDAVCFHAQRGEAYASRRGRRRSAAVRTRW
jgi:hypothetical protein